MIVRRYDDDRDMVCGNCRYHCRKGEDRVCGNPDSDDYGLETEYDDSCVDWEGRN